MKKKDDDSSIHKIKELLNLDSDFYSLKLPRSLKAFSSNKKDICPYDKLYVWIFKRIEFQDWMTVSDVFLTNDDFQILEKLSESWLKTAHAIRGKKLSTTLSFLSLERGPNVLPDEFIKFGRVKPGFVYIKKRPPKK